MVDLFEEFADTLTTLPDREAIWRHMAGYAYNRGFSSCSLVLKNNAAPGKQSPEILSDLSREFRQAYSKQGLGEIDPFLLFSCRSLSAKKIVTDSLSSFPGASAIHQQFLDYASQSGATNNLGIPVRTSDCDVFGGWIFSNSENEDRFEQLYKECACETHLAAVLAYERMVAVETGCKTGSALLSEREIECLLWLCAGLRSAAIAGKLNISESAVNLYITNAKYKLGAKTREQAVARAITSGEIVL